MTLFEEGMQLSAAVPKEPDEAEGKVGNFAQTRWQTEAEPSNPFSKRVPEESNAQQASAFNNPIRECPQAMATGGLSPTKNIPRHLEDAPSHLCMPVFTVREHLLLSLKVLGLLG